MSGEAPSNTSPGKTIDEVSFPTRCGQRSDSLLFKVVAASTFPVEWVDFSIQQVGEDILLNWTTTHELNCAAYQVERSIDGKSFQVLGSLPAIGNESESLNVYQYSDTRLTQSNIYYRIRQWDFDGSYSFSDVLLLQMNRPNVLSVACYPNPSKGKVNLSVNLLGNFDISILDLYGKIVWQQRRPLGPQAQALDLNMLISGIYLLRVEALDGGLRYSQKLILD